MLKTLYAMTAPLLPAIFIALFCLAPVYAQDQISRPNECTTALVQADDKGVLSTNAQCGLSSQNAKAIEDALFQLRHDLKPTSDQMRTLLAASNMILGAVLDRLIVGEMNLDGVMKIPQLLAIQGKAKPGIDTMAEAVQWKQHYSNMMDSLQTINDTGAGDASAIQALQSLDLDLASSLLDELLSAKDGKETATARHCYLRAQVDLLQFQPQNALPLLEKARQLQPDNKEYAFAYAKILQEQNAQGSVEDIYTTLLGQYRALAKDNPTVYLPAVATTLNNLGSVYSKSKRMNEAEKAYREALDIHRGLSKDNPAAKQTALAMILNNLGNLYNDSKRPQEAEKVWAEARDIQRDLARSEPSVYQPNLALTLQNLGNVYSDAKRMDEAEKAYREALDIRTTLAKDNPSTYQPEVAITLNNLGLLYRNSQHFDEAEKAYSEALAIQRELYRSDPAANAANLKAMLSGEAVLMDKMGRPEDRAKAEAERASIK